MPRRNPFPTDDSGTLINPDYIRDEGQRIMASIADGTYGAGAGANPSDATFSATNPNAQRPGETEWQYNMRTFGSGFAPKQTSIWDQGFGGNRSPRALRDALNLDELTTRAAHNRAALEESQRQAPLKEALAIAKIEHQRASTAAIGETNRLKTRLDTDTMKHVSGFSDYMTGAPDVGTDDYAKYVLRGLMKFPRISTTKWGKETLDKIGQEHDTIARLRTQVPPGFDISTMEIGGGKQSHITVKRHGDDFSKELKAGYGLTPGQIQNPVKVEIGSNDETGFKGDPKGNVVRIEKADGGKVLMSTKEYEKFGGKYSAETEAARSGTAPAAPVVSQSVDLKALAERALNDPNASEAHKNAARKLLAR